MHLETVTLACARNVLYVEVTPQISAAVDASVGVPQLARSSGSLPDVAELRRGEST